MNLKPSLKQVNSTRCRGPAGRTSPALSFHAIPEYRMHTIHIAAYLFKNHSYQWCSCHALSNMDINQCFV